MTHQGKEEKESLKVLDTFLSPSRNWKTRDPSVDTKCLQPIEYSNEGDLSARGIAHRSREDFVDKVRSSAWILKKALDSRTMSSNRRTLSTKFTRGHAYHRLQMYQKALDDYDACLTIEPTCSFAFYNRGCALYAMGKKEAAVIDFGKAMKVDPKCTLYIESKAIVLKELGKFNEAILDYALLDTIRNEDPNAVSTVANSSTKAEGPLVLANASSSSLTASLMPKVAMCSNGSFTSMTSVHYQNRRRCNDKNEKMFHFLLQFLRLPKENRKAKHISEALGYVKGWSFFQEMEETLVKQCLEIAQLHIFEYHHTEPIVRLGNVAQNFLILLNPEVQVEKSIDNVTTSTIHVKQGESLGAIPQSGVTSNPTISLGVQQVSKVISDLNKKPNLPEARSRTRSPLQRVPPKGMIGQTPTPLCPIQQTTVGSTLSYQNSSSSCRGAEEEEEEEGFFEPATIYYRLPIPMSTCKVQDRESKEALLYCLSIDANLYNEVMTMHEEDLFQERIDFLRSCRLFQYCPIDTLGRLALLAGTKTWNSQETILATGEVVKQLCLIKCGVCEVQKRVILPQSFDNTSGHCRESTWVMDASWVLDNGWMLTYPRVLNDGTRSKTPSTGGSNSMTSRTPGSTFTGRSSTGSGSGSGREAEMLDLTVATLARGQLFGELSVLHPGQSSQVTIRSLTMVEVLTFEESVLAQFNVQYIPGTLNALQESLVFHNPPQQKLFQLLKEWEHWKKKKKKVLQQIFPTTAGGNKKT